LRYLSAHGGDVAAVIMEPVMCNTGVISPQDHYLRAVKDACARYGIVFILDEVITGLRLSPGGAQEQFGVHADLSIFAKALANGFPLSVLGGRADIMNLIGVGKVNHSGTYNANLMSLAAGIATLDQLSARAGAAYRRIESAGASLIDGIREIAARRGINLQVTGYPSVFHTFFTDLPQTIDYFSYRQSDAERLKKFIIALTAEGVRISSRGTWFVSAAHSVRETDSTLEAIDRVLANF
jgi:glutamate-1-semialdehyde 2,1-aminomutase